MLSCQMLPTAQDAPRAECPAAHPAPQHRRARRLRVGFSTQAKKTLIKLFVLLFVIPRQVSRNLLAPLAELQNLETSIFFSSSFFLNIQYTAQTLETGSSPICFFLFKSKYFRILFKLLFKQESKKRHLLVFT